MNPNFLSFETRHQHQIQNSLVHSDLMSSWQLCAGRQCRRVAVGREYPANEMGQIIITRNQNGCIAFSRTLFIQIEKLSAKLVDWENSPAPLGHTHH